MTAEADDKEVDLFDQPVSQTSSKEDNIYDQASGLAPLSPDYSATATSEDKDVLGFKEGESVTHSKSVTHSHVEKEAEPQESVEKPLKAKSYSKKRVRICI